MSSYLKETKHPQTGEWETAAWLDDHFGHHRYGVKFADGQVFNVELYDLPTTEKNVDADWETFFPSNHEALPSDEKPQEAVGPRSHLEEEQVRELLRDYFGEPIDRFTQVYEGKTVTLVDALEKLVEQAETAAQTKAFKAGYERAWYDKSHGMPHRYDEVSSE